MATRNFDEEFDYSSKEGHTFVLGGYTFHTVPVAPPSAFLSLNMGSGFEVAANFLKAVVIDEDKPMLETLLTETGLEVPVSAFQIDQVASWLIGEMSGRPTESPDSSGNGVGRTSSTSKGKLSAVDGGTGKK